MEKGIGFSKGKPNEISLKVCCECIKEGLKTYFVNKGAEFETVVQSEPKASSYEAKITSKPKNSKPMAMKNSDSKTSKIKILKRSELVPQSLMNSESGILNPNFQRKKIVVASWKAKPKGVKPEVLSVQKPSNIQHKVQKKESKTSSTNPKGPIKICLREEEKQRSWYLDSGCSRHMTREKSMFFTLTMKDGGSMTFGGNQVGKIICT